MALTYFKRYRMEIDLRGRDFSVPAVPYGYCLLPWDEAALDIHAEVKYLSFRDEIDANVFPCFGALDGCQRLMREIVQRDGFLPEATWLAAYRGQGASPLEYCGTIQGIRDRSGMGAVQNIGITPAHRGRSLGTCMLMRALGGFRRVGLKRAFLEVTADNVGAIRLYRRLGFVTVKTVFKPVELAVS